MHVFLLRARPRLLSVNYKRLSSFNTHETQVGALTGHRRVPDEDSVGINKGYFKVSFCALKTNNRVLKILEKLLLWTLITTKTLPQQSKFLKTHT